MGINALALGIEVSEKEEMPKPLIERLFKQLQQQNPLPKTELEYTNPYTLLVAVVLSAQATDAGVNKATRPLFAKADTPEKMLELGIEGLRDHIKTINLYNAKAAYIIALSQILIQRHHSKIPNCRETLEALPGVGRKTANVVLNVAFNQPTIPVDTHVFRVANRTGLAPGKTPLAVEKKLEEVVPMAYKIHAHHWLVLHGRHICKARRPLCRRCPIQDVCAYPCKDFY